MLTKNWFDERLYLNLNDEIGYKQSFLLKKLIVSQTSNFQKIEIFDNPRYGRILVLDGAIQTTEADEFFYHEMFVHVPLFSHGNAKSVLIIGGGDGGILREVIKHKAVQKATMIEIDGDVISLCKEHMPKLNNGSFDNVRSEVRVEDGINYIKNTNDKFDVIIVDSTDPMNVGEVLFTEEFYSHAKRCLNIGGILTTQSGVPFLQPQELKSIYHRISKNFQKTLFYTVPVPTYVGSFMCLSFATDNINLIGQNIDKITDRVNTSSINNLKYYNPSIHYASFALPNYIKSIIEG